jgi:putative Holliday junction resolvase
MVSRKSPLSDSSRITDHASHPTAAGPELILGFDYGTRRIGVACGNSLTGAAHALKTLLHATEPPWDEIEKLVTEFSPARLVVGLPYNMDGTETTLTPVVRRFAKQLGARFNRPVELIDERLSSRAAADELRDARAQGRMRRRVTRSDVDMTAAKVLVEQWLRQFAATARPKV